MASLFSFGKRPKKSKKAILTKLQNKLKRKQEKIRLTKAIESARNQLRKY
jgi:hypothetical protein